MKSLSAVVDAPAIVSEDLVSGAFNLPNSAFFLWLKEIDPFIVRSGEISIPGIYIETEGQTLDSANPDMILRYKADASRNGLLILAALAPVWAIWMPWMMLGLLQASVGGAVESMALLAFFLGVVVAAVAGIRVCLDNSLVIGARGITIPVRFLLQTGGKTKFTWDKLQNIVFLRDGQPSVDPEEICLDFGKSKAPLRIDGFQREDLPKILLAVQAYAPQTKMLPTGGDIKGIPKTNAATPLTFTKIWEEELNNRFGSTIFVPLEPGHQLQDGRIKIVGQIAFGGLSAIYLAKLDDEKLVVVKEAVVPQNADDVTKAKALEMFNREAAFLVELDHERIARVFDHFMENARNYLLLQYIEGKDLRSYVKENGPVPEQIAARWAAEIADILTYLHTLESPIIHRDLTPDNIVLARDGSISLIDFGAANNFMGTATGTLVGKQSYISPEQFRGKAMPASDLYSLGCTLFFLLTGKDPEPLSCSHPRELNPNISPELDELVALLTEQETDDRIGPSAVVLDRLEDMCGAIKERTLEAIAQHHA